MNRKELENKLLEITNLDTKQLEQLYIYYELLIEYSKVMNLTTLTSLDDVYNKHFYDSLLISKSINFNDSTLADIGTGAGFPGLVLKIAFPNLKVYLIEPTGKRCLFLNKVIEKLELQNIYVINDRAEKYIDNNREKFDYVTARAVAALPVLLELCVPFLKVNGCFIAMKGSSYKEEMNSSKNAVNKLDILLVKVDEYTLLNDAGSRAIIIYKKNKPTSIKYPRDYAKIKKLPL